MTDLFQRIQTQRESQARYLRENRWSLPMLVSNWHADLDVPIADLWYEAQDLATQALRKKEEGDLRAADQFLQRAEESEQNATRTWKNYLAGTQRGAQASAELAREVGKGAAIAGGVGALAAGGAAIGPTVVSKLWELSRAAFTAVTSTSYWARFAKIGSTSAVIRGAYDWIDNKRVEEIQRNAAMAFVGGGLCGGLIPRIPLSASPFANQTISPLLHQAIPYNFVGLDILGDFSRNHLVEIRKNHGGKKGIAMAGGLLAVENTLAAFAFLPFAGSGFKAAKTAVTVTGISIGIETYFQRDAGRPWSKIDPGRFVGMSAWGHSIVILPEAILGGAMKAAGFAQAMGRTTELATKYLVFVNPSVNNFSAKINNQNWENVQIGNTARHASVMWMARFIQSTLGPSHPIAMLADEGIGSLAIAGVNEIWPYYEGIPQDWSQGFLTRVRESKTEEQFEALTAYLSDEMGSLSLKEGQYFPSPLNLAEAKKVVASAEDPILSSQFEEYVLYLDRKREGRTPQEQRIYKYFHEDRALAVSAVSDFNPDNL